MCRKGSNWWHKYFHSKAKTEKQKTMNRALWEGLSLRRGVRPKRIRGEFLCTESYLKQGLKNVKCNIFTDQADSLFNGESYVNETTSCLLNKWRYVWIFRRKVKFFHGVSSISTKVVLNTFFNSDLSKILFFLK